MNDAEKLTKIKVILSDGGILPSDEKLSVYLELAKQVILNQMYDQIGGIPAEVTDVPARYEVTQIYAVIAGFTHAGSEGETQHNENGINRVFTQTDMESYIRDRVFPIARVGAVITS